MAKTAPAPAGEPVALAGGSAHARVRVIDLETAGHGPTDVCEIGWQDVVLGCDGRWKVCEAARGSLFVNPGRPISPDTMAVHHILDEWVASAGFWKDVAPAILRPQPAVLALAAHRAAFEQRFCTPSLSGGADWICTWKCALRLWPHLTRFSNQMLRYQRRPQGLVHALGLPAHRALPDAYVTAHHLRDMLDEVSLETLLDWSREPGLLPRVPAGPDRGKAWDAITDTALDLLTRDRDADVRFTAGREQERRHGKSVESPTLPVQATLL